MSSTSSAMATEHLAADVRAARMNHWFGGFVALFNASMRRYFWSRRMLILSVLFCLPGAICVLARRFDDGERNDKWYQEAEMATILIFIPTLLTPLASLVNAAGMIQDEIEEQTLTYLLIRPIPRPAIYVAKLAAVILASTAVSVFFTFATYACLRFGVHDFFPDMIPKRAAIASSILTLSCAAYCALFGLVSLLVRRTLIFGIIFIIIVEGVLAAIPFNFRLATVVYYYRLLAVRWLGLEPREWSIDIGEAPSSAVCITVLLGVVLVSACVGGWIVKNREFRMKTPAAG